MIRITTVFGIVLLITTVLKAQIITVKQDGTGNFTTIQAAVNAAWNGDTILVWPGTYVENIHIISKTITLGSLTLTTGDLSYINQTVIDGNQSGSCIRIEYSNNNTINGFCLTNGNGKESFWSDGGGIFLTESDAFIYNCNIHDNTVGGYGGGIYFDSSNGFLSNVTITNNHAYDRGGGLMVLSGTVEFDSINRCNIYENYAAVGTDIYKLGNSSMELVVDTFTVQNPDYYYIYSADSSDAPQNDINIDILHHKIEQVADNLYVDTTGSNGNNGLSADQPLKTISFALLKMASDSISPDTIKVAKGTYSVSDGEKFPLSLKSFVVVKGASRDDVILDAENEIYLLNGIYSKNNSVVELTLTNGNGDLNSPYNFGGIRLQRSNNSSLNNIVIKNCRGSHSCGGSVLNSNGFCIQNSIFKNNIGGDGLRIGHGSAISVFYDTVTLINCKFLHNIPDYSSNEDGFGGGLSVLGQGDNFPHYIIGIIINSLFTENVTQNYQWAFADAISLGLGAKAYLINSTFTNNNSDNSLGANIGVIHNSELHVYNSIMYHNYPAEFYMFNLSSSYANELNIYNSLVDGGEENIRILTGGNHLYYDSTNINTDPLFYGGAEFPYNLSDNSPCIDAGTLDLPQFVLDNMPDVDLAGNPRIFNSKIDMGAYEWNTTVEVKENPATGNKQPATRIKAAPNPFSTLTYITAKWDKQADVNLTVYNNAGLLVNTLQSGRQLPGSCRLPWNGTGNTGNLLPAGVYLIVLTVDGKEKGSVKVVKR